MPWTREEYLTYHRQYRQTYKEGRNAQSRRYYQEHIDELRARAKQYRQNHKAEKVAYRQALKLRVLTHYSGNGIPCCVLCGITDMDVLTIDHIDGGGRRHTKNIGCFGGSFYWWLEHNDFPSGYQTLCANCNLKKEVQRGKPPYKGGK